ncbi:MAG: aminomethyl-transferring glycine dehydrogenase [Saprospiraceae bacterium]|nr:aminomethyl-transferring glycine dehydrogenase [Saprospiraceae bacterium]
MLSSLGVASLDSLIDQTVPSDIRMTEPLDIEEGLTEYAYLKHLKQMTAKNVRHRSYIGMGYYGTVTPPVIQRNILENPGWYTQYTPYQAEIAQGRLEALLNFQTVVSDLTALPISNASLLDEATAAAEAMAMVYAMYQKKNRKSTINTFFVDDHVFPHTVEVLHTRAAPLGIKIQRGSWTDLDHSQVFGSLLQYPNAQGKIEDYRDFAASARDHGSYVIAACDLLALTLVTPPGEWGAHVAVGTTQRFGIPMGFGGPHAAYLATEDDFKRQLPGRIIGLSVDRSGNPALRMALQTREQHIRREKATSNICTAQALLAIMAGMYAVYHGSEGLTFIAKDIATKASCAAAALRKQGWQVMHDDFFDTIRISCSNEDSARIRARSQEQHMNFWYDEEGFQFSIDETTTWKELTRILKVLETESDQGQTDPSISSHLSRQSSFLGHPVFSQYRTETKMMRYIKSLENKDLSLMHAMIPLGSCTMKLNAATQLMPLTWDKIAHVHPFAPANQVHGYLEMIDQLGRDLCEITGFTACSFQPNSGAQGEFTGLMVIRAYHNARDEGHRNIALIPTSAHGTNPASAVMAGMKVVLVQCDEDGNINAEDLRAKAEEHQTNLSCLMITYPSTHGVFEEGIREICATIHQHGGLVYMDGANMNAQVGLTSPGHIGADVCHLNLHKTFAIPHGGGGPGMGPICVNDKLASYLPGHLHVPLQDEAISAVSAAPFGSASILAISYGYIRLLGGKGLTQSTKVAILNANYIRQRLQDQYPVLYLGKHGFSAHELILDLRPFKASGIGAEDVAKRLIDYGFHAPTLSFPVPGTLMIEPTESEDLLELDRFCEAMIEIRNEIEEVINGTFSAEDNVLVNAPHTMEHVSADVWPHSYSRAKAAYPLPWLRHAHKFWAPVGRVDNAYGDRNLICTCPPIEAYAEV